MKEPLQPGPGPDGADLERPDVGSRIRERLKAGRKFRFWQAVVLLAAIGAVITFFTGRQPGRPGAVLPEPAAPAPEYRLLGYEAMSGGQFQRMNAFLLVRAGLAAESLRQVLDWALYRALDEMNRRRKQRVRVVWAYAMTDSLAGKATWQARAVWVDPKLDERLVPQTALLDSDAVLVGPVRYDYTNLLRAGAAPDSAVGKGASR